MGQPGDIILIPERSGTRIAALLRTEDARYSDKAVCSRPVTAVTLHRERGTKTNLATPSWPCCRILVVHQLFWFYNFVVRLGDSRAPPMWRSTLL
jgi:hypothetical protein